MNLRTIIGTLALLITLITNAAQYKVTGFVIDSINHEPIPYASIAVTNSHERRLADEHGKFTIGVESLQSKLIVSAMGFKSDTLCIPSKGYSNLTINLLPIGVNVGEVIVRPQKEKYSKRNNPAVDLSRLIAANRDRNDPRNHHDYFSQKKYERYSLGFNDIDPTSDKNLAFKKFGFLREFVDTSDVTGKPILILSMRELNYDEYFRRDPRKSVDVLTGRSHEGVDNFLDEENLRVFLDDILGDLDIFDNDVTLLQNKFVSPFSPIAPDFYKFYITDTVEIDHTPYIELAFVPKNPLTFGFTGKIYVQKDDPHTFIKKVMMNVPKDINLNFIDRLYITQEYERGPDSCIVKTVEDLTAEIKLLPGAPGLYATKRSSIYAQNYDVAAPDSIFNRIGNTIIDPAADSRGPVYWIMNRPKPLNPKEYKISDMMEQFNHNSFYYWANKIIRIMTTGYISLSKNSKVDLGPVNTLFSHNELEGYRFKLGAMTTANLCKNLFGRGYVAYGTNDRRWKYMGEVEYSFNDKKYHAREFPIHSLRAQYKYDVDMLGQKFEFTNPDNIFLSLRRQKEYQITYKRSASLNYTLELMNHFSVEAEASWDKQYATPWMPFKIVDGNYFNHYTESKLRVKLRYAPGEKFYQSKTHRHPITLDAPIISIEHTYAPRGAFGNLFGINSTEMSFQKRFWMSAFGYIDLLLKGGHIWGSAPYPSLLIPNANLSYTIQPESYSLMNAMEFINDSYASIDFTYWANGAILNYVPLVKKLKLREVVEFKGLWGHLSHRNDPRRNGGVMEFPTISHTQTMTNRPYMEVSVGLDNIFKILRVDYVWRLSYLNNPNIDKRGLRVALHVTF